MKLLRFFFTLMVVFSINGCVAANTAPISSAGQNLPSSYALKGTNTALVGIALGKDGFPVETVKEVVLLPGQKVIFAGPDRFQVVFKDKKTPNRIVKHESQNGVISIVIPKDILTKGEFVEEFRKNNFIKFNYSIIVNGKELDPPMIVKRDY